MIVSTTLCCDRSNLYSFLSPQLLIDRLQYSSSFLSLPLDFPCHNHSPVRITTRARRMFQVLLMRNFDVWQRIPHRTAMVHRERRRLIVGLESSKSWVLFLSLFELLSIPKATSCPKGQIRRCWNGVSDLFQRKDRRSRLKEKGLDEYLTFYFS